MNKIKKTRISLIFLVLGVPFSLFAADNEKILIEAYNRIKTNLAILNDGNTKAYGLYIAGDKNKKYMYFYSSRLLQIGSSEKIKLTLPGRDEKEYHAKKVVIENQVDSPIYRLEVFDEGLSTITIALFDSIHTTDEVWALGKPEIPGKMYGIRIVNKNKARSTIDLYGRFSDLLLGSPIFDSNGFVIGCVDQPLFSMDTLGIDSIRYLGKRLNLSEITANAKSCLKGLELYPLWKEVFPNEFVIEKVRKSTVLLDTETSGAGVYVGRDKNNFGYIVTAAHVVSRGPVEFSLQFDVEDNPKIVGRVLPNTMNKELDLAIVRFENCPDLQPAVFLRSDSLREMQKDSVFQNVASIGYGDYPIWRFNYGRLMGISGNYFESTLPLENQDSGGPLVNKNGEIIGINLKGTPGVKNDYPKGVAISLHSVAILDYLEEKLKGIEFERRWGFQFYRSFWDKNKAWIIPGSGIAIGAGAYILFNPRSTEKLAGVPTLPSVSNE